MKKIVTKIDDTTLEETSFGTDAGFGYRTDICDMDAMFNRICPWHWHADVEIFYMKAGSLVYRLPGKSCVFGQGDIGFINANVLHMTEALGESPCLQQEHIFLPQLVSGAAGDLVERKYVMPLVQNRAADIMRIQADDPEAPQFREMMDRAYVLFQGEKQGYELHIRACMSEIWLTLLDKMPVQTTTASASVTITETARIRTMIQYMQMHYAEPITLMDIVSAAQISIREGCRCFQQQIGTTAFSYLLDYRIRRSCEMLQNSDLPVTEIALRCGFSAPSYFGKVFRQHLHQSPLEYRRDNQSSGQPDRRTADQSGN